MNRTLSGRPAMSEARRNAIHGPLLPMEAKCAANWFTRIATVLGIALAVWMVGQALPVIVSPTQEPSEANNLAGEN
ncbi:MAG TPA: hypothetical protein PKJ56_08320 [Promineifilum sp.]|nr:hypothetical protein [Promineifilum sp.]